MKNLMKYLVSFLVMAFFSFNLLAKEKVYFVNLQDGQKVKSPVKIIFGLTGKGIAPAGINYPNSGHHHLLVNLDKLPDLTKPIPTTPNHIHFGKGQTETSLTLEPGNHTLQLLFADMTHTPHQKPLYSEKLTIYVTN
tara:strand:- start:65 stop:475 length:411 start_codon:yes stop_codon:yes gene_type:complete